MFDSKKNKGDKKKNSVQDSKEAINILPPLTPKEPEAIKIELVSNTVLICNWLLI